MKRVLFLLMMVISTYNLMATYEIGEVVENFSFTVTNVDEEGNIIRDTLDLYEQIDKGTPVMINFFGES